MPSRAAGPLRVHASCVPHLTHAYRARPRRQRSAAAWATVDASAVGLVGPGSLLSRLGESGGIARSGGRTAALRGETASEECGSASCPALLSDMAARAASAFC
uniref:Uncharacterized protein n=1 Tax=Phaeocystis cordata TaxID=118079 RepID=A0A7S1N055_9EUKA|mmetsp:Transcript_450/g.927  ORF Transcript_450/g.927 Transcript_450/m.927 type:complete len:103 (+) Transcript_450:168-476(+)